MSNLATILGEKQQFLEQLVDNLCQVPRVIAKFLGGLADVVRIACQAHF
jgi:hypothetical protein